MDSLLATMLLFVMAITALLTFLVMPIVPTTALVMGASILLAVGVWWHWKQFGVEYRTSTWQEQLRNYAGYVVILVVILLTYAFYVLGYSGSQLQTMTVRAQTAIQEAGRKASEKIVGSTSRTLSSLSDALFSEATPSETAGIVGV